jgi:hypothetical protein
MLHHSDFPPEIYENMAQHLVTDGAFGSCANLGSISRSAYSGTLPALYRIVDWILGFDTAIEGRGPEVSSRQATRDYRAKAGSWVRACLMGVAFPGAKYIK